MKAEAMDRRQFMTLAAAGSAAAHASYAQATPRAAAPARKAMMKVGTQHDSSDATLPILAGLGVNNICSTLPSARFDDEWSVEGLSRLKERVGKFGISLDMVPLPLSSSEISRSENPNIMIGRS